MNALRTATLLAILLVCSNVCRLAAQAPISASSPAQAVEDLRDPSFAIREAAEERLRRLGRTAIPALENGLRHPDPEIRTRCAAILPLVRRSDLDIELDAFLHNQREARLPALPGWDRFKAFVGEDLSARLLYVRVFREEKQLLQLLEMDPTLVGAQFMPRWGKFQKIINLLPGTKEFETAVKEFQTLTLIALVGNVDPNQFNQLAHHFFGRAVWMNRPSTGTGRLLCRLLAERMKDLNKAQEYEGYAAYLHMTELVESQVRPDWEKQIDEVIQSKDSTRILQLACLVHRMHHAELLLPRLMPAVREFVETAARSDNSNQLQQAVRVCQMLQMRDTLEKCVKPAAVRYILKTTDNPNDTPRLQATYALAYSVGLEGTCEDLLHSVAIRAVAEAAENAREVVEIDKVIALAKTLQVGEQLANTLVRPAAHRVILSTLENPRERSLHGAVNLCRGFDFPDLLEDSLKPVFRRSGPALVAESAMDIDRLWEIHCLAQYIGHLELSEEQIKPAMLKYFQTLAITKNNTEKLAQALHIAMITQIRNAVPIALQIAHTRELDGKVRGLALQLVGKVGTKEQVSQLNVFLKDTASLGQLVSQFEGTMIKSELRDTALALLLFRDGENPVAYGFPFSQNAGLVFNTEDTLAEWAGFPDNATRDAAFKKYQAFLAKQKK